MLATVFFVLGISVPVSAHAATTPLEAHTLIALLNKDRAAYGLKILTEDPVLNIIAQLKATDMAARGYFSHTSPNGQTPWSWLTNSGYYYTHAGENLAMDFTDPEMIQLAWMQSASHRANTMGKAYTKAGVGIARGMYQGRRTTFVVELFATPMSRRSAHTPTNAYGT